MKGFGFEISEELEIAEELDETAETNGTAVDPVALSMVERTGQFVIEVFEHHHGGADGGLEVV